MKFYRIDGDVRNRCWKFSCLLWSISLQQCLKHLLLVQRTEDLKGLNPAAFVIDPITR
jgi:hypothetical protein